MGVPQWLREGTTGTVHGAGGRQARLWWEHASPGQRGGFLPTKGPPTLQAGGRGWTGFEGSGLAVWAFLGPCEVEVQKCRRHGDPRTSRGVELHTVQHKIVPHSNGDGVYRMGLSAAFDSIDAGA